MADSDGTPAPARWFPERAPALPGESDDDYTNRLTGARGPVAREADKPGQRHRARAEGPADAGLSHGIGELAELIYWHVGVWHDLGYEDPPAPDSKTIPPLGERSADAREGARAAIEEIDQLTRRLAALRAQLVSEILQDHDARAGGRP